MRHPRGRKGAHILPTYSRQEASWSPVLSPPTACRPRLRSLSRCVLVSSVCGGAIEERRENDTAVAWVVAMILHRSVWNLLAVDGMADVSVRSWTDIVPSVTNTAWAGASCSGLT